MVPSQPPAGHQPDKEHLSVNNNRDRPWIKQYWPVARRVEVESKSMLATGAVWMARHERVHWACLQSHCFSSRTLLAVTSSCGGTPGRRKRTFWIFFRRRMQGSFSTEAALPHHHCWVRRMWCPLDHPEITVKYSEMGKRSLRWCKKKKKSHHCIWKVQWCSAIKHKTQNDKLRSTEKSKTTLLKDRCQL